MSELSAVDRRVLLFIRAYLDDHGFPPTTREMAKGCGFSSPGSVLPALERLTGGEYISREWAVSRGIKLLPKGRGFV